MGVRSYRDPRPLSDKAYQIEETKKLLDFLRLYGYANTALTSKHFPLGNKEFVNVFNFIYSILDPAIPDRLPYVKFEEEAMKTMKMMLYPGNLTKSNFQAMGSPHSWPTVLGCLSFLCTLANIYR